MNAVILPLPPDARQNAGTVYYLLTTRNIYIHNKAMMSVLYKNLILIGIIAFAATSSVFAGSVKPNTLLVWPDGKMPGTAAESDKWRGTSVSAVKNPTLELYKINSDAPTPLVIICPGGGYSGLAYDHEGKQVAEWVNKMGMSAAILKYRVPRNPEGAIMDIQRAIRLARANANQWNVKPDKIAVIGFSAGANLCARASTNFLKSSYGNIDEADSQSARPDLTCLIYPAYCDDQGNNTRWNGTKTNFDADLNTLYKLAKNLDVSKESPPVFIAQSLDDKNYINSGLAYFLAAKKAGISANLHVFENGGHGYGLANAPKHSGKTYSSWPELAENWFKSRGFIGK